MITKNIHILVGLPGCGKSTYAARHDTKQIYFCDQKIKNVANGKTPYYTDKNIATLLCSDEEYKSMIFSRFCSYTDIYIDGLFLTNDNVETVINSTLLVYNRSKDLRNVPSLITFIIEQWDENREACLINDQRRYAKGYRDEKSQTTIKNAPYEDIDIGQLELYLGITMNEMNHINHKTLIKLDKVNHETKAYSNEDIIVVKYDNTYKGILRSEQWSRGGSWGSYDGRSGSIEPDEQPDFDKLDEMLSDICPNISFLEYKYIMKNFVEIKETSVDDYYGGTEYFAHYECNLNGLISYLKSKNLIKE